MSTHRPRTAAATAAALAHERANFHTPLRRQNKRFVHGFSAGHWRADDGGGSAIVTQVGFTPTLRFWPGGATTGWFYEAAIGVNALTPVYRTREKRFSTAFNFGDHVALGRRSAGACHREWALRLQHYSNAGLDQPNPGENFVQLRLVLPLNQEGS